MACAPCPVPCCPVPCVLCPTPCELLSEHWTISGAQRFPRGEYRLSVEDVFGRRTCVGRATLCSHVISRKCPPARPPTCLPERLTGRAEPWLGSFFVFVFFVPSGFFVSLPRMPDHSRHSQELSMLLRCRPSLQIRNGQSDVAHVARSCRRGAAPPMPQWLWTGPASGCQSDMSQ